MSKQNVTPSTKKLLESPALQLDSLLLCSLTPCLPPSKGGNGLSDSPKTQQSGTDPSLMEVHLWDMAIKRLSPVNHCTS